MKIKTKAHKHYWDWSEEGTKAVCVEPDCGRVEFHYGDELPQYDHAYDTPCTHECPHDNEHLIRPGKES